MRRNFVETLLALIVIAAAGAFAVRLLSVDLGPRGGTYVITAEFDDVGSLVVGDAVTISGLPAGEVVGVRLDPDTLFSLVDMAIDNRYRLPTDTTAAIGSGGLTGGGAVVLRPGAEAAAIPQGGLIVDTKGSVNTVDALGRRIFSGGGG